MGFPIFESTANSYGLQILRPSQDLHDSHACIGNSMFVPNAAAVLLSAMLSVQSHGLLFLWVDMAMWSVDFVDYCDVSLCCSGDFSTYSTINLYCALALYICILQICWFLRSLQDLTVACGDQNDSALFSGFIRSCLLHLVKGIKSARRNLWNWMRRGNYCTVLSIWHCPHLYLPLRPLSNLPRCRNVSDRGLALQGTQGLLYFQLLLLYYSRASFTPTDVLLVQ